MFSSLSYSLEESGFVFIHSASVVFEQTKNKILSPKTCCSFQETIRRDLAQPKKSFFWLPLLSCEVLLAQGNTVWVERKRNRSGLSGDFFRIESEQRHTTKIGSQDLHDSPDRLSLLTNSGLV